MFHSTRGNKLVSSPEAILNGLADDGGLYVIDKLPKFNYKDLMNDDYQTMAAKILHSFFPEFEYEKVKEEIDLAYSTFDIKNVVELKKCDNAYFLELFHGPTLAFKDLALVVLPRLMKLSKEKLGYDKNITILTATSGDTGGAALNGFKDISGISIVVLYPNGGVSPVQEAQMCSFRSNNAKMYAIEGNFDDCQSFVKKFFNNHKELSLSSANSINIARLAPQIVYYFYSYIYLVRNNIIKDGEEINFDVPTGNFGNIFAGFYAKALGLPINELICASNKNNVLTDFFNNGNYNKNRPFFKTNSPSMDILISSNLERFVYYGLNDTEKTKELMEKLVNTGMYDFNNPFKYFYAFSTNEEITLNVIKEVYEKYNYLIDPHTAVAYNAYKAYLKDTNDKKITVVVSTASPYKFPQACLEAFNIEAPEDAFKAIDLLTKTFKLNKPAVLNYPEVKREVVKLNDTENKIMEVIKCFK